jgi:hypothetical protein
MDLPALHEYIVKVSVFLKAAGHLVTLEAEDAELFSKYAAKLAEQGLFATAAKYSRGESQEGKILRDSLYRSKASPSCLAAMGGVAPEFPFAMSDVTKSRAQPTKQNSSRQHMSQASNGYSQQTYTQQNTLAASASAGQTTQPVSIVLVLLDVLELKAKRASYPFFRLRRENFQRAGLRCKILQVEKHTTRIKQLGR